MKDDKVHEQIAFILKVTRRYKANGGYIWQVIGKPPGRQVKIRVSLANFILDELGALVDQNGAGQ